VRLCGIVGILASAAGVLPTRETFSKCVERLRRRGPDDAGIWSDNHVRLGHRRLSIVDLSAAGHQPMVSADGRYVIVYNGEIYNHAELRSLLNPLGGWKGTSDTETLLEAYRAWGVQCLQRLNGMFAFAIWDGLERRMFLARDRMGVKPLYYSWSSGTFVFSSRPGAMTALVGNGGGEIDPESLRAYLELGYIPAPLSFYKRVRKLPAGHYLLVDSRGPNITRYWDYRHIAPDSSLIRRTENELIDELDALIRSAVKLRLMGDVPVGAFLSGGVDSAYVVAAMKAVGQIDPKAFTIAFEEGAYNEGPAAAQIARHIGVEHVVETLSVQDLLGMLPLYIEEFDEPFADSSAFPTMAVSGLARRHVTVALTGDAGDELFGGYHYYSLVQLLSRIQGWPSGARQLLRSTLGLLPSHRAKLLTGALGPQTCVGAFHFLRSFSKDFAPLVSAEVLQHTASSSQRFERFAAGFAPGLTSSEIGMRLDLGFMLSDGYLQKLDVSTMALSLEARCPLVDYRLVEWSLKLPVNFKLRGGTGKYLLKKALCRYLPEELVFRPKKGFGAPVAQWLRGPLRSWARDLLHEESVLSRLPLDKAQVRALYNLHTSESRDAHPLLWSVLMLLCYIAKHDCGMDLPPMVTRHAA
jgi:asparagine synthase (glutamine-hydrolysing)